MPDSLFTRDGAAWLPTSAARGPWGEALHGGAPAALICHALEEAAGGRFPLARLTLDLFRPVPSAPLEVEVRTLRSGRRLLVQEATLSAAGVELVRATSVHGDEVPLPASLQPPPCPLPSPDGLEEVSLAGRIRARGGEDPAGQDGLHLRLRLHVIEGLDGSGVGAAWVHLPLDLAPGVPLTPVTHLAACSDFANGLGQRRLQLEDGHTVGFINSDISLHLLRAPSAKRVGMASRNETHAGGRGLISAECWEADGLVARVTQTVLVMAAG
ncbi:MAG TPA: thioesterase family protein [Pseudomonadales bacterium]|nr:thioesterase family protein [Pseudomonadales bacterium]